ncbi:MAG: LptF/LptG family permease [Spirochaetia bacterium]
MTVSSRFILINFIRFFIVAWMILVSFVSLIDLLNSFINYLNYGLSVKQILLAFLYNIPSIMSLTMPFAGLFASSYLFGKMNSELELLAFMTLGYSIRRLILPQILIGLLLCLGNFILNESLAVPTMNKRLKILEYIEMGQKPSFIVFKGENSVFYAERYIEAEETFEEIMIIIFTEEQHLLQRVDARYAIWTGENWQLKEARVLNIDNTIDAGHLQDMVWDGQPTIGEIHLSVRGQYNTTIIEAHQQIQLLKQNGMSYRSELLNFIKRFISPFSMVLYIMTPILLRVKKNSGIILSTMSHFAVAAIFTVLNMITGISARNGNMDVFYATIAPFAIVSVSIFIFSSFKALYADISTLANLRYKKAFLRFKKILHLE